jgi:hypothetical protein
MTKTLLPMMRLIALLTTLILSLIAILYVLDVFSGEVLKEWVLKTIKIMGIIIVASLVIIFVTGGREDK